MGDSYYYNSGVRLSIAGGRYGIGDSCGPLAFDVAEVLTSAQGYLGSSGIRSTRDSDQNYI